MEGGQAKVSDLDVAGGVEEDVTGFQVSVDHALGVGLGGGCRRRGEGVAKSEWPEVLARAHRLEPHPPSMEPLPLPVTRLQPHPPWSEYAPGPRRSP